MATVLTATSGLFADRDFFVHDGTRLRRFRITATFQILIVFSLLALVGWSSYAIARLLTPTAPASLSAVSAASSQTKDYAAKIAQLAAETERRVQLIEQRQLALAAALAGADMDEASLQRLGFVPSEAGSNGQGGPFDAAGADPTFKQLFSSWKKLDNIASSAIAVPSDKPVKTAAFTSGYGLRSDPFRGGRAMHAGIDLAGPSGTPIYATADGAVRRSGWNSGGYGNLIEVDHGRGIETRYGHLSRILVRAGQPVKRGQLIGYMGSTGRSTGSHLHYEVRIDGRPVNPIPFMRSTDYLVAMQKNATTHSMDAIALGGPTGR
jgi:murein DD-endopeptidase MepM/ murein hydrolase activator NlpD